MHSHVSTKALFVTSCLIYIYIGLASAGGHGRKPYTYSLDRKNTCSNEATPCYDYTLTLVKDGICNQGGNRTLIVAHHEKAGRSEADAILEGKMATAWFKSKYGIDFTNVPDEAYLDGAQAVTNSDGTLTFSATMVSATSHTRMVAATKRDKAEFFNSRISDAGWMVKVNEDYTATGEFNGVLPKGAMVFYADLVLEVCKTKPKNGNGYWRYHSYYKRKCLFQFHRSTLVIHYESNTFSLFDSNGVSVIDFVVKEDTLGVGAARGVCFRKPDGNVDARSVLTFPATL